MDNLKKILEVLNDLIRINRDREVGYNKVSRDLTPAEHNLRSAFERKAQESRNNIVQLQTIAVEIQHQLPTEKEFEQPANSVSGKIYKMWEEVKDFFSGKDKSTVLRSCVDSDAKATSCYENALRETVLPENISSVLNEHKASLADGQKELKSLLEAGQ